MNKLYKIVSTDFGPLYGGKCTWFAPKGARPGKWMPKIDDVQACRRGYHLIPAKAIVEWLPRLPYAGYLCEAEGRGASDKDGDKIAFAKARLLKIVGVLDEKSMRLAAADMAERVLPLLYKVLPKDKRPAQAIQAARDFANGKIDAAARDAAWGAAWAAAKAAAWDAAWAAAKAAAWDAAWDAARAAAGDAARAAAWAAAGDAAWAAAWAAAWDAAGAAAKAAAWDAAWAAAGDANAEILIACAKARHRELLKKAVRRQKRETR